MKSLLLLPLLLIIACAKVAVPETPAQIVYTAEANYAAALRLELAYSKLPRCPAAKVCSDPKVIKKVQQADNVAWDAILNAQRAVRTPGFGDAKLATVAASAVALTQSFVDITATLEK